MNASPILLVVEERSLRERLGAELRRRSLRVLSADPQRALSAARRSPRPAAVVLEELSSLGFQSSLEQVLPWLRETRVPSVVLTTPFDAVAAPGADVRFVMTPVPFGQLVHMVLEAAERGAVADETLARCA